MAKSKEKFRAKTLRKEGKSIKEIAKLLIVSVSSVSAWCRDILLTEEQINKLQERIKDPGYGNKTKYLLKKRREFEELVANLKLQGIKKIGQLTQRDIFLIGVALYWGEGFKKDHQVGLATSDKNIARFFIYWLKKCFNIEKNDLIVRVTANISYKKKIKNLENFWAKELNIFISQFSKPFFQKTKWKKEYENKNQYHGVIRIKVRRSVNLLRKIYGFIEGVSLAIKNK